MPGIVQFAYRSESCGQKLTPSWSAGDTLRVRFDRPVNVRPDWPLQGERAFVDSLFGFSAPLGANTNPNPNPNPSPNPNPNPNPNTNPTPFPTPIP